MRVNARKENSTMADLDLTILKVNAPADIKQANTLSITVDAQADQDAFDEDAAYSLFVYVNGLKAGPLPGTPLTVTGTLQKAPWGALNVTIPVSITAGTAPDIYTIEASLLVGPTGAVFQASPVFAGNQVVVHP